MWPEQAGSTALATASLRAWFGSTPYVGVTAVPVLRITEATRTAYLTRFSISKYRKAQSFPVTASKDTSLNCDTFFSSPG